MGTRSITDESCTIVPRAPYTAYARVYDRQGQSRWSECMVDFTIALLPRYGAAPRTVLDLACGTGAAARRYAQSGYRVTGIDRSPAMLAEARRTGVVAGVDVRYHHADMCVAILPAPVDLVTCYFDSLNYLTDPADLVRTFAQVRAALVPGGLFVADMNTVAGLAADWDDRVRVRESAGTYIIEHTTWDDAARIGTLVLTGFVPRHDGYDVFEETHRERGYTIAEITAALTGAGLTPHDFFACDRRLGPTLEPPDMETHRIIFVARNDGI